MNNAGTSVTNSCANAVRFETPAPPVSARDNPVNGLLPRRESVCAKAGSGTRRSSARSGGMSSGLSFASTMM